MGSTHIDLGATTEEARKISEKSRKIVKEIVGDKTVEDRVRQRCVIATGDPEFKDLLQFNNDAVTRGVEAVKRGTPIFCDIKMIETGILKKGHNCKIMCVLGLGEDIAHEKGITRTSAGFFTLGEKLNGSIVVIGNAPSATLAVYQLVMRGVKPVLIVATPVGFVQAAESKKKIHTLEIPSITCIGTKGGTPVAVAIMNELITIAVQSSYSPLKE
ncbi:MAG: precorrin-8X methylmutase [Asgard group archaeon]